MKKSIVFIFLLVVGFVAVKVWLEPNEVVRNIKSNNLDLLPGKVLHLDVPNFGGDDSVKRVCEVRIPENYKADKPVPILAWFSPGGGSNRVSSIPPIVDFRKFLIVAIPYPNNKLPRIAIQSGNPKNIDSFWEYEEPMLEYVKTIVPNISKTVRIAGGFSSGAHLVGSGLDRDWLGFTDFFTGYVMHEGGGSPDMQFKGIRSNHKILVTYGLQNNSYGKVVVRKLKKAGISPTVIKLPHTGHAMSQESIDAIREWIDINFNFEIL